MADDRDPTGSPPLSLSESPKLLHELLRPHPANTLLPLEVWWRDHALFLESRGYRLRPRLRPGWIASWTSDGLAKLRAEDGIFSEARPKLMDATRISDGELVYIKNMDTECQEYTINLLLGSSGLQKDPRNHSVPILDVFQDAEDPSISFVVMPYLRPPHDPKFQFIGEVLDFGEQVLEGLAYMHEQGVAHRDCAFKNMGMDSKAMYPNGFHPIRDDWTPDMSARAKWLPRLDVGARYYFFDYGISSYFPPGTPRTLVTGNLGRDQEVPELSDDVPYDPFKVDVFIIGNALRHELYELYSNIGFLAPFIDQMTHSEPSARPTAEQMLREWRAMRRRFNAVWWREHALFLESRGYRLRPRLRPGWIASWKSGRIAKIDAEDNIISDARPRLMDATRISDGELVYIKNMNTGCQEYTIALLLGSDSRQKDSRNHSVPILDVFQDAEDPSISFVVMPFLRPPDDPEFQFIGEILDFGEQVLEGLAYIHEQGVAHRDCAFKNMGMDSKAMYPKGFHPIRDDWTPDMSARAKWLPRLDAGARYYFFDYGISSYFPPGTPRTLVTGNLGRDQQVPELSDDVPYDPFKVDIFIIGNALRREIYDLYSNIGFLGPFIDQMTRAEPSARPTAEQMLREWRAMRRRFNTVERHWRLRRRGEWLIYTSVASAVHVVKIGGHLVKWASGKRYKGS
ncbi:hypothetical protein FA95DRAFT_1581433 [Auriscalpium vulgare]|uniref:Uncharacterized protein n=1 Tax=Auriscalpium vulgare TaxID=40419 RepID=A0ACB8S0K5_9AGAM|nr:hypothetical protein FA95DRAFT_1581433 [Auriscalpium vulgare]